MNRINRILEDKPSSGWLVDPVTPETENII